jgi:MFS superfamily sulfate permease-like transporter
MAGTLLLHLGIDLFLEGAVESYGDYDTLEYSGICLIMIVMVTVGMDQALVAGLVRGVIDLRGPIDSISRTDPWGDKWS